MPIASVLFREPRKSAAAVPRALADERSGLLAISSISTDHISVKDKDLDRAGKALGKLGINVVRL